ncbi:MAG: hypothetical protein ACR2JM_17535 [Mycobacterium sp.]
MSEADDVDAPEGPRMHESGRPSGALSKFGVISLVLALLGVLAAIGVAVMWSGHRGAEAQRSHQALAMQAAAEWTGILINMNAGNVEASMAQLRDGTVGELNSGFESSIAPYRDVVKTLRSRTTGRVESVSIEVAHNDSDPRPEQRPPADLPPELAERTDTVLVVATSVSENAGNKAPGPAAQPTTVRWNLRLGVSEVDGKPMISRLESLR